MPRQQGKEVLGKKAAVGIVKKWNGEKLGQGGGGGRKAGGWTSPEKRKTTDLGNLGKIPPKKPMALHGQLELHQWFSWGRSK